MKNSYCEKLLKVKLDLKLTFNSHTSDLSEKAGKNVHAPARVKPYLNISKEHIIMDGFFQSKNQLLPSCMNVSQSR